MPKTVKTIESLMLEEHKRINRLICELEEDLDDYEKTKENFSKFKWNVEKHFFVEEKIIFNMFIHISGQETTDIFHLLEDHVKIMQMIREIEDKLGQKIKPSLEKIKDELIAHRKFEDEDFYPNLDKRLSIEQKKKISERIREVIPG